MNERCVPHCPFLLAVALASTSERNDPTTVGLWLMRTDSERWERLATDVEIPGSGGHYQLLWDPGACRVLAWAGGCYGPPLSIDPRVSPATVTEVSVTVDIDPRYWPNLAFDPVRRRVLVHGGSDCDLEVYQTRVYALEF